MERRTFLKHAAILSAAATTVGGVLPTSLMAEAPAYKQPEPAPMALGLLITPDPDPEAKIKLVRDLGFKTCFLSLDGFVGKFTPALTKRFAELLNKYQVIATAAEVVAPQPLKWNFLEGPATIGLVPPAYRRARLDALKQCSDFAASLGISHVQTHCGFIPEDPKDALYQPTVAAVREITEHCAANKQSFLMETGQETPTAMLRMLKDVNNPALGVGLDTANVILYGKANPVDTLKVLGPHVQSVHAKDGKWPTDPDQLGEEVPIGKGEVDFPKVFSMLRGLGYKGAISIERETSGPSQIQDVKAEKLYLDNVLNKMKHA